MLFKTKQVRSSDEGGRIFLSMHRPSESSSDSTRSAASDQGGANDSTVRLSPGAQKRSQFDPRLGRRDGRPLRQIATHSPEFTTIRSTPRQRAINLYSHTSVTNAITIRSVTVKDLSHMELERFSLSAGDTHLGDWAYIQNDPGYLGYAPL